MTAPIDTLRAGAAALGVTLSDRQAEQLLAYGTLMLKWNKVYNLTALRDPATVLTHHLLDSLRPSRRCSASGQGRASCSTWARAVGCRAW
jgi:16S rRNA G527 N7-methylase RsmG